MNQTFQIADLILKANKGELSDKEKEILQDWMAQSKENQHVVEKLLDSQTQLKKVEIYQSFDEQKVLERLQDELTTSRSFGSLRILRYAATLFIPILAAAALTYFFNQQPTNPLAGIDKTIKPGSSKAVLILAEGTEVELDTGKSTVDIKQGKTSIDNAKGKLSYLTLNNAEEIPEKVIYNELRTPKGGTYELSLADGTHVILNAGSSLKYPINFSDSIRKVYLTGEAYFEVTHSESPFIVANDAQDVRVLGTIFNVMAYDDEPIFQTTLVAGSVRIETPIGQQLLTPGQQSSIYQKTNLIEVNEVNTDSYTSWVRGKFEFTNNELYEVIAELSRWYDFQYHFENQQVKAFHFTGRMDRSQSISSVLEILKISSDVEFEFSDNRLTIK